MASGDNLGDDIGGGRVRILMPDEYNKHAWSFFTYHIGNSWHGKDARLIFWMGSHWVVLTVGGFILAGVVGVGLWWGYARLLGIGQRKGQPWMGKRCFGSWRRPSPKDYELVNRHEV